MLRVFDHAGRDLDCRIDGNAVRGEIPTQDVLDQLARGARAFAGR